MTHFHNISPRISLAIEMRGNLLNLDVLFFVPCTYSLKWSAR
jgi:hypothetical protein